MRPVLLKKSEISQAQAIDRAREVQEGMKLSRRVDDLRKLQANEEQTLEKWRTETLSAIGEEINTLEGEKEDLKIELIYLREELNKESLLTRNERLHLEDVKLSLDIKEKSLEEKEKELSVYETEIAQILKNAKDSAARALTYEDIAKNLQRKAQEERNETSLLIKSIRKQEDLFLKNKDEAEKFLDYQNRELDRKEKAVFEKEKENIFLRNQLEKEKIQLADQRATLQRAMNRIKNK